MSVRFYLGTDDPGWLARTDVPLFVSRRRLVRRKALPRALGGWALDSGGFTELQRYGRWTLTARQYADEVVRFAGACGRLAWAAPQDWMCEPVVIAGGTVKGVTFAGTGLDVREHQKRTTDNFLELRALAPGVPWAPVLQGFRTGDYLRHARDYADAGVALADEPTVGVGSVCRRQGSREAHDVFVELASVSRNLHGFGLKTGFVTRPGRPPLGSFDSMAWSYRARRAGAPIAGCTHRTCAHCLRFALQWRARLVARCDRPVQSLMF